MLKLTKRTEYALIALVHIMDQDGHVVSAREISERYPVPRRLLAEVLKELCRADLLESQRGAAGGYLLARAAEDISLGAVVGALEGLPSLTSCDPASAHAGASCEVEPVCPIKSPMARVRAGLWDLMQRTTLRDLGRPRAESSRRLTVQPADPTRLHLSPSAS
jgi:Rrf2 family protein